MTFSLGRVLLIGASLTLLLASGCRKANVPPPPLAAEQIPAELQKAFASSTPEFKDVAQKISTALAEKDYPTASAGIQVLFNAPGVTKPQRVIAARAMLTINQLLQEAQAAGDQ